MFHQAKKYVVCNDKEYLQQIIDAYHQLQANGQVELIHRFLFRLT
jgi:alpha-amylase/alpha-mannosidase (GH57 family)